MRRCVLFCLCIIGLDVVSIFQVGAAETCKYQWEFDECIQANQSWWAWARSIESFVCLESQNPSDIMFQIILDKKFKEIDKDIQSFLCCLEDNKSYYFWPDAQENFFQASELISKLFWWEGSINIKWICLPSIPKSFHDRYKELCNGWILSEAAACMEWKIPNVSAATYFQKTYTVQPNDCLWLAETKLLKVYEPVVYNILKLNKMQVQKDEKKKYFQKRRGKYGELIDMLVFNQSYIERIWKKWNVRLKDNVYQ